MRIVFDTGVVVSALLIPGSVPRQAFDSARKQGALLVSAATLGELDDVLRRPQFDRYIGEDKRLEFLAAYVREALAVSVTTRVRECRDASDDKFLELALDGAATHIVSGDPDLLVMSPFHGLRILTPRDFLPVCGFPGPAS